MNSEFKNTLFVTDLDGTLFAKEPVLSDECVYHIKKLNSEGIKLTFSTARTYRTVDRILRDVPLPIPVSLMNGTMIRNVKKGLTLDVKSIPDPIADKAGKSFLESGILPLVYRYKDGEMLTYYSEICGENMKIFIDDRIKGFGKPFIKVTPEELFMTGPDSPGEVIYFCAIVKDGEGDELLERLNGIEDACLTSYKDNASDSRYIEIYSPYASKRTAVQYLKRLTNSDKLITFGDNFNDLTMFSVSDLCFA
ncbi:MAG: HAD hydrolase family protein, partial [Clostridia bacterium]|nr:HAD hydrolase family protein [Clostridia bacterium]